MKPLQKFCVTVFAAVLLSGASYGNFEGAEYVRNYDGDTITFNLPGLHPIIGQKVSVRVEGIDTPEIRAKCGREKKLAYQVKDYVRSILEQAGSIRLENMERGKYFRIVARGIVDGKDISEKLLNDGLAVPYGGGTKTNPWCEE